MAGTRRVEARSGVRPSLFRPRKVNGGTVPGPESPCSTIAPRAQLHAQSIELDEARRILLVIGAGVILEGHVAFAVQAVGRLAADDSRADRKSTRLNSSH